jgi:hypothetical protein
VGLTRWNSMRSMTSRLELRQTRVIQANQAVRAGPQHVRGVHPEIEERLATAGPKTLWVRGQNCPVISHSVRISSKVLIWNR